MPKKLGTEKCPKCQRWAYMAGGKCEFCEFNADPGSFIGKAIPGRKAGREIVRETVQASDYYAKKWTVAVTFAFEGPVEREAAWRKAQDIAGKLSTVVSLTEDWKDVELVTWKQQGLGGS